MQRISVGQGGIPASGATIWEKLGGRNKEKEEKKIKN
jgi:hypothetical protein